MMNLLVMFVMVSFLMVVVVYALLDGIFGITERLQEKSYKKYCIKNGFVYVEKEEREELYKKNEKEFWKWAMSRIAK